jgi:hypothetical protein
MNAFRKLLLAPVVLGLAAPVAAQAQSLDMGNVNRYTQQQDTDRMRALEAQMGQVTSVSQFSDVYPTDWAYQALANLVETYGCVAGYPDGTFKGNIALTRYEAAALLNACLDRVTEITEELKRLMKEFEKELVVLKARVDGLEAQTAELAATQFSTTTKLSGVAYFWLGGAVYNGGNDSPNNPSGDSTAEADTFSAALVTNTAAFSPGGSLNNFTTTAPTAGLTPFEATKGATWSGSTGSGGGTFSTTANNSTFTGDAAATYAPASLANISYGTVGSTLSGVAGGAYSGLGTTTTSTSTAATGGIAAGTVFVTNVAGASAGQLGVSGLANNGITTGTPGFDTDAIEGMDITPASVGRYGNASGATFSSFTLDKADLANLVRLGNKARAVKGFGPFQYQSNIVANSAINPGGQTNATAGYQISTGGLFTNTNIYTDPYNASVAEYGTLSKAQYNTGYVKKAAKNFLKGLWQNDVEVGEAVSFNYDTRIDFNTSFTGKDLLRTRFRSGNFGGDNTFSGTPFPMTGAEIAYEEGEPKQFNVNRLFYQFPVGDAWTLTAGPVVRQDDMLAVWPSQYPAETIMDFFTYAGAPGAYSLNLGAGAGISYAGDILGMDGFAASANYVSNNGQVSFVDQGGIANQASGGSGTVQLAYTGDDWNLTGAYAFNQNPVYGYIPVGTPLAGDPFGGLSNFSVSSWAISGWYAPDWGKYMPSISAGWGINDYTAQSGADVFGIEAVSSGDGASSQSWYVGVQWPDVFLQGNYLGTAVGQPTFVSSNDAFLESDDSTFAWELWYKFQVTDNVSITPAYFYIDNPSGLGSNSVNGAVVKTSFTF